MLKRSNLHKYQLKAADFIIENKKAALWIDMGLGKTVSTLTALSDMIASGKINKTLVIAPLRVAQHTWPAEIANWKHTQHLSYEVLSGLSPAKRTEAVSSCASIHIINRENVPWLVEMLGQQWHYDCVVIDESSSFKSHSSKRWKSMRKVLGKIDRMIHLTGTPAPNSLMDLWPQMYLLDKGERLENTRGKFLEKYCTVVGNPQWNQYAVKPARAEAIHKKVSDLTLRMEAKDYLELPNRVDSNIYTTMPSKAKKIYEDMKRDFIVSFEQGEILAVNAAVQIGKLLQIANGSVYDEDGAYTEIHQEKLNALSDLASTSNENLLVAYNYRSDLARIKKALPQAVELDKSSATINKWNTKQIPILLAHPASAGHGLNLQSGGNVIVWFGLPWSLELYQQFNARLHRQGQTKPVRIIHIMTDGTADEAVLETLQEKRASQDALLEFVKKINL
jgi:SNF2 family DNA or RNA helicase